jgi:hypothetical protein
MTKEKFIVAFKSEEKRKGTNNWDAVRLEREAELAWKRYAKVTGYELSDTMVELIREQKQDALRN